MFKIIPMNALVYYSKEIYPTLSGKIPQEEFIKRFKSLSEVDANNFFRACSSYNQSQKCLSCDPENTSSIGLSILCTSIETISQDSKKVPYQDWLWKFKINSLENKPKTELEKLMKDAYKEYLKSPLRTGARYDFTCFLIEYGQSEETDISPIKLKKAEEQISKLLSFEDTVNRIYEKYRSHFIHESLKKIDIPDKIRNLPGVGLLEPEEKGIFETDVKKLPIWFSNVVKNSLYNFLLRKSTLSSDP